MRTFKMAVLIIGLSLVGCKESKKETTPVQDAVDTEMSSGAAEATDAELRIVPIEHATAIIYWEDKAIYIDPVGGAAAFEGQEPPDLILITDIHGDHLNVETLQALETGEARILVPQAVADELPETFSSRTTIVANGDSMEVEGIGVEAIPMYNLREEAKEFHVKGRGNGYVLNLGGERLYFSGDTEDIPEMRALKNIDKAFICMNLPYTMNVQSAADAVLEFAPKEVYPYHFRGRPDVGDVSEFKRLVNEGNPDIEVVQLDWYPAEPY